jgi:hypothetical protein
MAGHATQTITALFSNIAFQTTPIKIGPLPPSWGSESVQSFASFKAGLGPIAHTHPIRNSDSCQSVWTGGFLKNDRWHSNLDPQVISH